MHGPVPGSDSGMTDGGHGRTGRPWRRIRAQILAASDTCWLCGNRGADTVDHIIPLSRGGAGNDPANLRPAHKSCNSRRGAKMSWKAPPETERQSRQWV